mgnify:CR=1 FL=1
MAITNYKESRHDAFIQLTEKRVNKALRAIESVEKLSEKKNYVYSKEESDQLIAALKEQVIKLEKAFDQSDENELNFKFK